MWKDDDELFALMKSRLFPAVVGDILELAARYRDEGADELVFYDITASPATTIQVIHLIKRIIPSPLPINRGQSLTVHCLLFTAYCLPIHR